MNNKEKAAQQLIKNEVFKAIDLLNKTAQDFCKRTNSDTIHKDMLNQFVEILKKNYNKGAG